MRKGKTKRSKDTAFDSFFCLDQGFFFFIFFFLYFCFFIHSFLSFNGFQKLVVMK